jgi:hypothetical protein
MKNCAKCNQLLPKEMFHKRLHKSLYTGEGTIYLSSYCIKCNKLQSKHRRQTLKGLFSDIYNGQILSSKKRNMPPPDYAKLDLERWLRKQSNFFNLTKVWVESNFKRLLKPSCDRINNSLPYTLDNIQLVVLSENFNNFYAGVISGVENKNLKPVNQYTVEGVFITQYHSINEACRNTSCSAGNLLRCCKGEYKTSKGFIWRYANAT